LRSPAALPVVRLGAGQVPRAPYPELVSDCRHYEVRFIPEPDVPFPFGYEVCLVCGARRSVEGDHDGEWVAADAADATQPQDA
jgi:hypothetical protein